MLLHEESMSVQGCGMFARIGASTRIANDSIVLFVVAFGTHLIFLSYFVSVYSLHRFANLYGTGIFIGIAKNWSCAVMG
jgi:hypothetical protein